MKTEAPLSLTVHLSHNIRMIELESNLSKKYRHSLVDWWQNRYCDCLVRYQGKVWFVKKQGIADIRRNLLASLLGGKLANVAQVRCLDKTDFSALRNCGITLPENSNFLNTCLVRFAPDYNVWELPKKTLESAIAAEIVFSIWIRRRDAHSYNRNFKNGIPVFYDHQTAFLGEKQLREIDYFFRTGPDPGYAGLWRLDVGDHIEIDTDSLRSQERERFCGCDHYVALPIRDTNIFHQELNSMVEEIVVIPKADIRRSVQKAGFSFFEQSAVTRFLQENQKQLIKDVDLLRSKLKSKIG